MKRNAFGQLILDRHPFLRFNAPGDGGDGGGGNGSGDGGNNGYTPPATQEELDKIITARTARAEKKAREDEAAKFKDYNDLKAKADQFDAAQAKQGEPKTANEKTQKELEDLRKQLDDVKAQGDQDRQALIAERTQSALNKALEGRTLKPSALTADRSSFVKDGKVDADAIKEWAEEHSTENPVEKKRIPGQGERNGDVTGLEAGRAAYERRHPQKKQQ